MNILLLVLIIVSMSLDGVFSKEYNKKTENKGTYVFCAMTAAAGGLYFLISSGGKMSFEISMIPYILSFALSYAITLLCFYLAILKGPLSLSSLATSYSLIIPTLFGIIYYKEESSSFFILGLLFMTISLFLINWTKDDKKASFKWAFYAFCAFLFNGLCTTVQVVQQKQFDGLYKNELMIISYVLAAIIFLLVAMKKERGTLKLCAKKGAMLALFKGMSNGFMNFLIMVLSLKMASSFMFPIISVGRVIMSAVLAAILYKERLTLMQNIGLVFGLGAIVFLNI